MILAYSCGPFKNTLMSANAQSKDYLEKGVYVSPIESLIAGSISGAVARAITAPLDTIKIRLQLLLVRMGETKVLELVKSLLKNEGVLALWKGNVPAEALYIIYGASQFTSFSTLNRWLSEFQEQNQFSLSPLLHLLIIGSGTGLVSTIVTYPFDLLRTRLAANESRKSLSLIKTCNNIYKAHGIRGFFLGIRPSLLSIVVNTGLFFSAYSATRVAIDGINESSPVKIRGVEAMSGLIAGIAAKTITFPLDTIRKRMQVALGGKASRMLVEHWRVHGFFNFYKGFGISLIKSAPTSALSIATYEYVIRYMRSNSSEF